MDLGWKNGFNTILKLIIQFWLLGLFMHIFGLPALKRFNDNKVVVVTSSRVDNQVEHLHLPLPLLLLVKTTMAGRTKDSTLSLLVMSVRMQTQL